MSIQNDLKKEGIEVTEKIDAIISNDISKDISRRLFETFPDYGFTEKNLFEKLSKLDMYMANMVEGMAEANYYYKNTSIYFNNNIDFQDLSEFAIHECIHYLQEKKDEKNNLLRMGLCTYKNMKPSGLGLNEAAVQTIASFVIGVEPSHEKYYNISLYTPSPSYYPLECALLNQITYFTGKDILYKSTLFSNDDFKNLIIAMTSDKTYDILESLFDKILKLEEKIIRLNNKINELEDGDSKINKITNKISKIKQNISKEFITTQNLIIKEFFNCEFSNIHNLEQLEELRHKLYKYSDIIGTTENYKFFDEFYAEMMNKLEHKCNVLENGGIETALVKNKHNRFVLFFKKLLSWALKSGELN